MILDELLDAIATAVATLLISSMVIARVKVECDLGWSVGGVTREGSLTCIEKIKVTCCGEPAGIICERPCPQSRIKFKRIHCTGGSRPVVVDDKTVGCTR